MQGAAGRTQISTSKLPAPLELGFSSTTWRAVMCVRPSDNDGSKSCERIENEGRGEYETEHHSNDLRCASFTHYNDIIWPPPGPRGSRDDIFPFLVKYVGTDRTCLHIRV